MKVSYEGVGYLAVTAKKGTCLEGQPCKIATLGRVDKCAAGDAFCGIVEKVRGDVAAVQMAGFATIPYTGTVPTYGYCKLSSNGTGGVKVDTNGREYLILYCDLDRSTVTFKL